MIGSFRVKPDPNKSYQINCYELHKGGLNWLDIAKAYGWIEVRPEPGESQSGMYVRGDEREPWSQVIAPIKKAYKNEMTARGEEAIHIPPGGAKTFRASAAEGYVQRIWQRLAQVREGRLTGADVELRSRADDLSAFFKSDNPDLFVKHEPFHCDKCEKSKSGYCRDHPRGRYVRRLFSDAGYAAGVSHANTAPLNPAAGPNTQKGIS
jgi:hypothetical protein